MALGILWLGLALLGALQTHAQDSTPNLIPAPPLLLVPVEPDFQNEQFQGKWYFLGLAGNGFNKEKHRRMKMYIANYELNEDNSYNVTSTVAWNQTCHPSTKIFLPNLHLGQFNLGNIERYTGIQNYTSKVVTTDYNQFAILYFKKVHDNQEYIKVILYGRTKEVPSVPKAIFISFIKSLGLTDDHIIFPIPNGSLAWASASQRLRVCQDSADECMDK